MYNVILTGCGFRFDYIPSIELAGESINFKLFACRPDEFVVEVANIIVKLFQGIALRVNRK